MAEDPKSQSSKGEDEAAAGGGETGFDSAGLKREARGLWQEIKVVAAFLTRVPVFDEPPPPSALAEAARAFPLVGALVGLAGAVLYVIAVELGVAQLVAALIALAGMALLTGALHEDGLADVADGFGAGTDAAQKLEIMRDSRIGAYGVLALIFSVSLRAIAIAQVAVSAGHMTAAGVMIAAAAGSRGMLPLVMAQFPTAREDGLASAVGQPARDRAIIAAVLGVLFILLFFGPLAGLVAVIVGAVAVWAMAALARRQIGGLTGDVLGAVQQAGDVAILIAATAVL